MNRGDIIQAIAKETELTRSEIDNMIGIFLETIKKGVNNGEKVKLVGFGSFYKVNRKARLGRNPKTGEEIPISARRVVTFRAGHKLKSRVEHYSGDSDGGAGTTHE